MRAHQGHQCPFMNPTPVAYCYHDLIFSKAEESQRVNFGEKGGETSVNEYAHRSWPVRAQFVLGSCTLRTSLVHPSRESPRMASSRHVYRKKAVVVGSQCPGYGPYPATCRVLDAIVLRSRPPDLEADLDLPGCRRGDLLRLVALICISALCWLIIRWALKVASHPIQMSRPPTVSNARLRD